MSRFYFFFVFIFFFSACTTQQKIVDPYAHIGDKKVINTLKKSFATLGGLNNWQHKKELHYEKHTKLYFESGEIENETYQYHDYLYANNPSVNISWKGKNGSQQKITSIDGKVVKYINGKIDKTVKTESLNTSVTTSLFVIGVPFKMLDKGVTLSHEGKDILEDGQEVEVIKAVYNPSEYAHHTKPDIWWYYFDNQDFKMVAYLIKHDGRFSYVRNLSFTKSNGFLVPIKRGSYRVNSERKILFTRADYEYKNWKIK